MNFTTIIQHRNENYLNMEVNGNSLPSTTTTTTTTNNKQQLTTSSSVEDLSEYTDADESISAPTEILAEFLSAVMLKDYETALKYCKMILQYEPNHATAKEFYPLILEKIIQASAEAESKEEKDSSDSDSSDDNSESESEEQNESSSSSSSSGDEGEDEEEDGEEGKKPTDSDATTASYSSLEDEEADNTHTTVNVNTQDDNVFLHPENGNKEWNSDSESPTEPVSQQQLAARLRADRL